MLMRNGYNCPKLKSAIMSFAFMDGVREGDYWLPLMDECKLRKIPSMPPMGDLADMLADEIAEHADQLDDQLKAAMQKTAERLRKFPADSEWMVGIMYTIKPDHPIFAKGYTVPKKVTANAEKKPDLDASFFIGAPMSKSKKKLTCTLGAPRVSKTERERLRIAKLEEKLAM